MATVHEAMRKLWAKWRPLLGFKGSNDYWQQRYRRGGDSGIGSGGETAKVKADAINAFVAKFGVGSVIELGCGDGRQLTLARYPKYLGLDISPEAVRMCSNLFASDTSKRFGLVDDYPDARADLSLSLDVLFHLVEDRVYEQYLHRLFGAAERFVVIFSSDEAVSKATLPHVRHRNVSRDIASRHPEFEGFDPDLGVELSLAGPHDVAMGLMFYRRK